MPHNYENNPSISTFVEYLQIASVQPNVIYGKWNIKTLIWSYLKINRQMYVHAERLYYKIIIFYMLLSVPTRFV